MVACRLFETLTGGIVVCCMEYSSSSQILAASNSKPHAGKRRNNYSEFLSIKQMPIVRIVSQLQEQSGIGFDIRPPYFLLFSSPIAILSILYFSLSTSLRLVYFFLSFLSSIQAEHNDQNNPQGNSEALGSARTAERSRILGCLSYDRIATQHSHEPDQVLRIASVPPGTPTTVIFFTSLARAERIRGTTCQRRRTILPVERARGEISTCFKI